MEYLHQFKYNEWSLILDFNAIELFSKWVDGYFSTLLVAKELQFTVVAVVKICLLYTSDAADE